MPMPERRQPGTALRRSPPPRSGCAAPPCRGCSRPMAIGTAAPPDPGSAEGVDQADHRQRELSRGPRGPGAIFSFFQHRFAVAFGVGHAEVAARALPRGKKPFFFPLGAPSFCFWGGGPPILPHSPKGVGRGGGRIIAPADVAGDDRVVIAEARRRASGTKVLDPCGRGSRRCSWVRSGWRESCHPLARR